MSGKVCLRKQGRPTWFVRWWDRKEKKEYRVESYPGHGKMFQTSTNERHDNGFILANKLLAMMQADQERGVFYIEKYTKQQTDVIPYMAAWIEAVKGTLSPATERDYRNSIRNHLTPFFSEHTYQLHEIQYDVLVNLLGSIKREGKGKANVMYCLHACLDYAWRSKRIEVMPPFPKKGMYHIQEPIIKWITEDRQMKIINAIPEEHRPIFLWLKYHLRRPSEAMALRKEDYDGEADCFIVRRSISARRYTDRTKTGAVHIIPCSELFKHLVKRCQMSFGLLFFVNPEARNSERGYSREVLARIWKNACQLSGEDIGLYQGLKHSSCCQYVNEKGLSISELQTITDHARLDSVKKYARVEVARKRELMSRKVISLSERTRKIGNSEGNTDD